LKITLIIEDKTQEIKSAWIYFNENSQGEKVLSGDYFTFLRKNI